MIRLLTILFFLIGNFAYTQGTISGKVFLPSDGITPLPKVAVYRVNTSTLVATLTVNVTGNFTYSYPTNNTTYYFEPYFDSIPSSTVTTNDFLRVALESQYINSPNNVRGLYLDSGFKWFAADVKEINRLDLGQAYSILKKNYFRTTTRVTGGTLSYKVFSTHNRNGSTSQYGQYANNANDFNVMFNTANSNTVLHSQGNASPSILFYFTNAGTLTGNGIPVPNNGDFYGVEVTGTFIPKETGVYTFGVDGDDGVDLSINGTVIASYYGPHGFGGYRTGTIAMIAGTQYTIRARMQEFGGGDGLAVAWRRPSQATLAIQADEIATISSTYTGPKVYWFTESAFNSITINNWNTTAPTTYFPVVVTSGNYSLNLKYIVKGNLSHSSR